MSFTLEDYGVESEAIVPGAQKTIHTETDGTFAVTLWVNGVSETPARYRVTFPSSKSAFFILPAGADPVALADLLVMEAPDGTGQYQTIREFIEGLFGPLEASLTAHIQSATAHGTTSAIVGVDDEQTLNNKTFDCGSYD